MFSQLGGATKSSSPAPNPFAPKPTNGANNPFAPSKTPDASGTQQSQQNGGFGGFGGFGAPSGSNVNTTAFGGFGAASSNDAKRTSRKTFQESDAESSDGGRSDRKRKGKHEKKGPNGNLGTDTGATSNGPTSNTSRPASTSKFGAGTTAPFPPPAIPDSNDPHAQKVYTQLRKDGITPPKWPSNPGHPNSAQKMSKFREEYEAYRDRVRKSLTKAGIIDDPDKRRALKDAIEFKGISEEMCPEFEKIRRITEFDVQQAEKDAESNHAVRDRMVKKLARSAAGQEAPLPMDVRSIAALRRTMNYLIDDLLQHDGNLPTYHGFLWDRTRAIRRDFTFFSTLEPEELLIQVSVLENIARFHVTSLHLLSRADMTPDDFSEHQEREQLGKTLLSLRDLYDDCNVQGIVCENETEFRAYFLIYHAETPMIMETLQRSWKPELWRDSDDIRTAVTLVEALQSTSHFHGPLKDGPTMAVSGGHHAYFNTVEDPSISYTMACFAEIHFAQLRQYLLKSISKALARPQGETTDVSAATLNSFLRFDTVQEAMDFAEEHGITSKADPEAPNDTSRRILKLNRNQQLDQPKLTHQYSRKVVEKKRGAHSLPEVIHRSVYPDPNAQEDAEDEEEQQTQQSGPPVGFLQNEAPGASSVHRPAEPPKNPFTSLGQRQLGSSSAMSNGVPASQLPRTDSPFGGSSAAQPANNPFASAFKPTGDTSISSANQTAPPAFGGPSSGATAAGTASTNMTDNSSAPKAQATVPPTFGQLFKSKPIDKASKPTGTTSNTTATGGPEATTTPQSSPPQSKKPMFPIPDTGNAPSVLPSTTAPGSSIPSGPPTTTAAPSGLLKFNPAAVKSETSSLLPTAAASKTEQPTSSQGLAPSPFGLKRSDTDDGPALSFGNKEQSTAPTTTIGGTTSSGLFKPQAPPQPPAPPKDLMGSFTNWFVKGDRGLMEDFEKFVISTIVEDTWKQHHRDEAERKKREEEEAIELEVETFRVKNIQIKAFYKWKRIARERRLGRLRRQGRDELRAYRVAEAERKREEAAKEAAAEKRKRKEAARAATEGDNQLSQFFQRKKMKRSQAEEDLLASGVLSGVTDEKESAKRIVHRTHLSADRQRPSTSDSRASSVASTPRKASGKLQAIRDRFTNEKKEGFRRSLPPGWSRNTLTPEPKPRRSAASTRWTLKAMGLVEIPDGTALPENMADEALYGDSKTHRGVDTRPRSSSLTTTPRRQLSNGSASQPFKSSHLSRSTGTEAFQPPSPPNKRKRSLDDATPADSSPNKRVMSENERLIQELRAMREDLEEGTQWFREHNERFASEISRGTTPWDDSI